MKRRIFIGLAILVGLAIIGALVANPVVSAVLRSERHRWLSDKIMLITIKQPETSALKTFPVDYLREADTIYVGADSDWWQPLEGGAQVRMLIQGRERSGRAMPILNDPDRIESGFKKLRPSTYWRALWTGAVFIEIKLENDDN